MNLGLSIFLSTILICLVWLYYITRDRWKWKKIFKWLGIGIFIVGIILTGIFLYNNFNNEKVIDRNEERTNTFDINGKRISAYDKLMEKRYGRQRVTSETSKPEKLTELEGIALEESQSDVKFVKGKPIKNFLNPDYWVYKHKREPNVINDLDYKYAVIFNNKIVVAVIQEYDNVVRIGDNPLLEAFQKDKIFAQGSPKDKISRWGNPTSNFDFDNDLKKLYFYPSYNVLMIFEKNKLTNYGIYLPEYENEVKELVISKNSFFY